MGNLPITRVLLDDGTGSYPYDVTEWVEAQESLGISEYGRGDEFTQAQAAQLALTFENVDGEFTSGLGFGLLPFGLGAFGTGANALYPDQGIRVEETFGATTRNRFTGKIEGVVLGWPGGGETYSTAQVTAFDPLADCARKPLRSMAGEEILAAGVAAYHPLSEAEGASGGGDMAGQQTPLAVNTLYPGQSYAFGTDMGLVDQSTGATLTQTSTAGNAPGLFKDGAQTGSAATWTSTSVFMSFVFLQNGFLPSSFTPVVTLTAGVGVGAGVIFDSSGRALFNGCTSPANLMDGLPHVISVQAGGGLTTDLWVDGVKVATAAPVTTTWTNATAGMLGQGEANAVTSFAHFAYGPRTSDAQVLKIHQALLTGFAGETTSTRFARICGYLGVTGVTTAGMSSETMPAQSTADQKGLDALTVIAAAEGGVLYCNGDGELVLQGRYYRGTKTTPDVTLPADDLDGGTTVVYDTQQKFDQVQVSREGGATQTAGSPQGLYPSSLDLVVSSDQQALAAAQWRLLKHLDPGKRIGSLTFNLFDSPNAEALLQLEVGDRVSLSAMPGQQYGDVGDVTIEGWAEQVTEASWTITANVLPWQLFEEFILDDATYGVLDSAVPMSY